MILSPTNGVKGLDEDDDDNNNNDNNQESKPNTKKKNESRSNHKDTDKRDVVKRLESGGRILSLIKKAETKRVAKRKIITFLKKKGVSESKIIEAYSAYYKEEGLYEITFNQRPLGFSVIMDTRGKNAIVSSIQDETNEKLGMKVASRVYEINGKRVDDLKHKDILKLMAQQPTPFYVVFKESRKKSSKLDKRKKKIEQGYQWKDEDELENEEEEESDSDTVESYDSDDDEAHVANHYHRKKVTNEKKKRRKNEHESAPSVFKPHEIDKWDKESVEKEQAEMLKQLSRLMMGAVSDFDKKQNTTSNNGGVQQQNMAAAAAAVTPQALGVDGMTHKRQATLKTLLDVTANDNSANGQSAKHKIKKSVSRKFSVTDLQTVEEDDEYDPEIFKYLSELVGDSRQNLVAPLTPSTSKLMKDLFTETGADDEISLNLPDSFPSTSGPSNGHSGNASLSSNGSYPSNYSQHSPQYSQSQSSISDLKSNDGDDDDEDVIESLEQGTTLLKYGKYGKPKYKMFHLTPDHKYLVWFSQKKSHEETRIKIKEIRKIAIGSDSKVVEKTKKTDLHETSFTIYYGKATNEKMWKSLTVTAKNEKEAFVWAQGLKILSDASKKGKHLRTFSKAQLPRADDNEDQSVSSSSQNGKGLHKREESVVISIDKMQRQSVLNLFGKSSSATATSLLKQHAKHKQQLQKCVDFVMTKANYRAIANAGQFDKVKLKLEDLDNRLRDVKSKLTTTDDVSNSDLSSVKAELFSCAADLDALKQKLTAIVRRPQKL